MVRRSSLPGTGIEFVDRFYGFDPYAPAELLSDSRSFIIVEPHLDRDGSVRSVSNRLSSGN
jgi:hypothetical protein